MLLEQPHPLLRLTNNLIGLKAGLLPAERDGPANLQQRAYTRLWCYDAFLVRIYLLLAQVVLDDDLLYLGVVRHVTLFTETPGVVPGAAAAPLASGDSDQFYRAVV